MFNPFNLAANTLLPIAFKVISRCDPLAFAQLEPYQGKTICIDILHAEPIYLRINETPVICQKPEHIDLIISGRSADFVAIMLDQDQLSSGKIRIHGDTLFAKAWQDSIKSLDINWEAELAKVVGMPTASIIAKGMRKKAQVSKSVATKAGQRWQEYLHGDSGLLPQKETVEAFYANVDTLRLDVERFEARLNQFARK